MADDKTKEKLLKENIDKLTAHYGNKRQHRSGHLLQIGNPSYNIDISIGGVNTVARNDTGADISVTPLNLLPKIKGKCNSVEERRLKEPIIIELSVKRDDIPIVTVISEIKARVDIRLPGSGLPVKIRNTKLFVTEHEMEVVLLRRDFLDKLGFNFSTYLQTSYHKITDLDLEENTVKNIN